MKSSHSSNERKVIGSDIQRLIENYMTFPAAHRTKMHSTNPLECLNGEIGRGRGPWDLPERSRDHSRCD
jgi:hypothetical protein